MNNEIERALAFLEKIKSEILESDVELYLPNIEQIEFSPGELCSGYFSDDDPENPIYAVAMGDPTDMSMFIDKSFSIAIHEYCHFIQWRDKPDFWNSFKLDDGKDQLEHVLEHFRGDRDLSEKQVADYCIRSSLLEQDCEKMVIDLIKTNDLPINCAEYSKGANAYITFYYALPKLKSWGDGEPPYRVKSIYDKMPDHMNISEDQYQLLADQTIDSMFKYCM